MPTIDLSGVTRSYAGPVATLALREVSVHIAQGEFVAIEGPSGGGKSTLLNLIGLLDAPSSGTYMLGDVEVGRLSPTESARTRSRGFAFIFQNFHLLDRRSVLDSVELGLIYRGVRREERIARSLAALDAVGLDGLAAQKANTLSGGQRQRVAIARALASGAPVVVADEPTGNLDSENSALVLANLRRLQAAGATVVMVTHSPELAAAADRRLRLIDGRLSEIPQQSSASVPAARGVGPAVPGRASTVRLSDLISDGVRSLTSRRARSIALASAVALGVGLAVATAGISLSARAQVSDAFNAHLNRDVSVRWSAGALDRVAAPARDSISSRLRGLAGVDAAGVLTSYASHGVQVNLARPTFDAPTYGATREVPAAARMTVRWAKGHPHKLEHNEVLLGNSLASQMDLGTLETQPTVTVDGRTLVAVGRIIDSPRLPQLLGAALLPAGDVIHLGASESSEALILTQTGAAQQVAKQAPLVINPYQPKSLAVSAPVDPSTLRNQVEGNVEITLVIVTAVALLGSIAGLANSMTLAVAERKQEIGLRRAVGALPRHIAWLIFVESAIVGVLGGALGLAVGLLAILAATISQRWIPVFDLRLAPAAIVGGVVVGALGGILASARASRVQPNEALRL